MNVVTNEVMELVNKEYEAAKAANGPLASLHEGYAVLLEEMEETQEACKRTTDYTSFLWDHIRRNNPEYARYTVDDISERAIHTACEAIQVAAVCKRITDHLEGRENDHAKT